MSAPATDAPTPEKKPDAPAGEEPRKPESRVVVIGDSDFPTNSVLGVQGNRDFFLNTVNWLAQQENLIAIRPREPEDRRLTLTADAQSRIFMLSVFLLPGLVVRGRHLLLVRETLSHAGDLVHHRARPRAGRTWRLHLLRRLRQTRTRDGAEGEGVRGRVRQDQRSAHHGRGRDHRPRQEGHRLDA